MATINELNINGDLYDIQDTISGYITLTTANTLYYPKRGIINYSGGVGLGKGWDGSEKTFTITVGESGTYLAILRCHICGASSIPAGAYIRCKGPGFDSYLQANIVLSRSWDAYNTAAYVVSISAGTHTYTVTGIFENSATTSSGYGSDFNLSLYKLAA